MAGPAVGLALALLAGAPVQAGGPAWLVNVQEIAPYTPLEIKLGYDDSGSTLRLGAAALYSNGSQNVIDLYNFSADANGVTVEETYPGVISGALFALGAPCVQDGVFILPYIDDFDVRALRWDDTQAWDVAVDTSATNHTSTDCVDIGGGEIGIASLDFDVGEVDYYQSFDDGVSFSLGWSYSIGGDSIIGPFSGGFRTKAGTAPLMDGSVGVGLTYQLASGPIHSVLLDPSDGSLAGGPVNWDNLSPHGSFIGNGSLKEITGKSLFSSGYAFGAANGGSHIGLGWLDLNDGTTGFQLLNPVTTNDLDFQGLSLESSWGGPDDLFVHILSNRHVRMAYDAGTHSMAFEEIPGYPFADVGGAVDAAYGSERLYIASTGPATFRGTPQPTFQIATMNTDPTVMEGQPLGGGPGGPGGPATPALAVPVLGPAGLLALLVILFSVAWWKMRRV
jgi:hypothetical protein